MFYVADTALQAWPDLVLQIMGQVIVMQATRNSQFGYTLYTAISQQFAVVSEGEKAPVYEWVYENGLMRARVLDARK